MKIISVNCGLPRDVMWMGRVIKTGIFKEPGTGHKRVFFTNIEGDMQADLTFHGGEDKAVYAYAAEHYALWKTELGRSDLPWGMFGENLTIEGGLYEDDVMIGDRFRIGTAEAVAVQPRLPCYKLGIRFGTQRIVKQFAKSGRFGVYFRVLREGSVHAGNAVTIISRSKHRVSVGDIGRLLIGRRHDPAFLKRAAEIDVLPENLREHIRSLLT